MVWTGDGVWNGVCGDVTRNKVDRPNTMDREWYLAIRSHFTNNLRNEQGRIPRKPPRSRISK
jgi:hypothetical protein